MSIDSLITPRKPTESDWKAIQPSGKPEVVPFGKSFRVRHHFPSGEIVSIPTTQEQMKETVLLPVGDDVIEVPVALVFALHGAPCEVRSRRRGGESYKRV